MTKHIVAWGCWSQEKPIAEQGQCGVLHGRLFRTRDDAKAFYRSSVRRNADKEDPIVKVTVELVDDGDTHKLPHGYTTAAATDVAKTFARIRREMAEQAKAEAKVVTPDQTEESMSQLDNAGLDTYFVDEVKPLSSGYVRVSALGGDVWAQMPESDWELLLPGDLVPREFTFEPNWARLKKRKA